MTIAPLMNIWQECPENVRLAGLDLGDRTIGLALSDSAQRIATPSQTVRRVKFGKDAEILGKFVGDYQIGGFVMGYPVNMDGSEGPRCDVVRSFADEMAKRPHLFGENIWVGLWDERLTTFAAESLIGGMVSRRKAKESGLIDKLAAQQILQSALDFMQRMRGAGAA